MAWKVVKLAKEAHVIPDGDIMPHQEDAFCVCGPLPDTKCPTLFIHQSMADEEAAIAQGMLEASLGLTKPASLVRRELIV